MTTSQWRKQADAVVRRGLANVPVGASVAYKRQVLFPLYPFGARQNTPYRHWLRAVHQGVYGLPAQTPLLWCPQPSLDVNLAAALAALGQHPYDPALLARVADLVKDERLRKSVLQPDPQEFGAWGTCPQGEIIATVGEMGHLRPSLWKKIVGDHFEGADIMVRFPELQAACDLAKAVHALRLFSVPGPFAELEIAKQLPKPKKAAATTTTEGDGTETVAKKKSKKAAARKTKTTKKRR